MPNTVTTLDTYRTLTPDGIRTANQRNIAFDGSSATTLETVGAGFEAKLQRVICKATAAFTLTFKKGATTALVINFNARDGWDHDGGDFPLTVRNGTLTVEASAAVSDVYLVTTTGPEV